MSFAPFSAQDRMSRRAFNERFAGMLTDDTAARYGLGKDAVPDDALRVLSDARYRVGDVTLSTMDLEKETDGRYLYCDGRTITRKAYPELCSIIDYKHGPGGTESKTYNMPPEASGNLIQIVAYDNDTAYLLYSAASTASTLPGDFALFKYTYSTNTVGFETTVRTDDRTSLTGYPGVSLCPMKIYGDNIYVNYTCKNNSTDVGLAHITKYNVKTKRRELFMDYQAITSPKVLDFGFCGEKFVVICVNDSIAYVSFIVERTGVSTSQKLLDFNATSKGGVHAAAISGKCVYISTTYYGGDIGWAIYKISEALRVQRIVLGGSLFAVGDFGVGWGSGYDLCFYHEQKDKIYELATKHGQSSGQASTPNVIGNVNADRMDIYISWPNYPDDEGVYHIDLERSAIVQICQTRVLTNGSTKSGAASRFYTKDFMASASVNTASRTIYHPNGTMKLLKEDITTLGGPAAYIRALPLESVEE